jgi:glycosyltransferase involved in cell wall biosynthesis
MHVYHFCDTTFEGDYFRTIAAGLTNNGVRVSLVGLGDAGAPTWLGQVPGVTYKALGATRKWQYPLAIRRLAQFLRDERVDILHTHLFYSGLVGVLTKRLYSGTVVAVMRHHTSSVRMLGSRFHVAADKWMAERADRTLTVSEAARRYMIEIDLIGRRDIEVAHLGFDFEKFAPRPEIRSSLRQEFGFADDDLVVGYVGNFTVGKGHKQLVEAFGSACGEIPNARLFLVGRGNLSEVEEAAAAFPPDKIVKAGWRADVPACLNAMDIFVQPSLSEAFSQVLIEAMGVGLPVVATKVGGADEVIENGVNGILVPPEDTGSIAGEIIRLARDQRFREAIGNAGMRSVCERFAATQMVERHYELYKNWLQN